MNEDALDSYRPVRLGTLAGLITIIAAGAAHLALAADARSRNEARR